MSETYLLGDPIYEPLPHGGRTEHQFAIELLRSRPADRSLVLLTGHRLTWPRVPGRDHAGTVNHGPVEWIGAKTGPSIPLWLAQQVPAAHGSSSTQSADRRSSQP